MATSLQHPGVSPIGNRDGDGLVAAEPDLIQALGITDFDNGGEMMMPHVSVSDDDPSASDGCGGGGGGADDDYADVPDPVADAVDLSDLRGVSNNNNNNDDKSKNKQKQQRRSGDAKNNSSETELEGLAELVPDVKARRRGTNDGSMTAENMDMPPSDGLAGGETDKVNSPVEEKVESTAARRLSVESLDEASTEAKRLSMGNEIDRSESMRAVKSRDCDDSAKVVAAQCEQHSYDQDDYRRGDGGNSGRLRAAPPPPPAPRDDDDTFDDYPDSEHVLEDEEQHSQPKVPKEFMNMSSAQSISTATQTHEVRMPMYLPTFKPATGCTNASDFIVRCFVARLRSGITVVKHGRSRWCKSRLRILHIHPDGRSLSWKPAEGEPTSNKRPPKLDLSTCQEVRHAWSPDPQNPMYTGTPILRQKCEAANAHKSFALIFKQRTVDITAVTADQCKVLMEGFSALCFRLQVANLAGRGGAKKGQARPMPEEDGVSTTASATLTNTSTPRGR